MDIDIVQAFWAPLYRASPARLRFTRKAFHMLPVIPRPRILDVGCGYGDPTLELARLTDGEIIGIDIDQRALEDLAARISEAGFSDRVHVTNCSMEEMQFENESFDIIWSEGSIFIVGFEAGLREWRRLLKPGGFLVVHEMALLHSDPPREIARYWQAIRPGIQTVPGYVAMTSPHGYDLFARFSLPEDFWWIDYYAPLERRIREFRDTHPGDGGIHSLLEEHQREVDFWRKYPGWYGSVFLLMRRVG